MIRSCEHVSTVYSSLVTVLIIVSILSPICTEKVASSGSILNSTCSELTGLFFHCICNFESIVSKNISVKKII